MAASPPGRAGPRAENDVYTALLVVAFLFALAATIFVIYKAQVLFGSALPPAGG
jgi:hypothetical protein